ncbi:hypothetical protein L6241_10015 [Janibacter sp. Y6]|uniref:hypothetical protein n=1 Tax=Janibacter sp. Y6 TaxID=2913552 RepID=UPI0034A1BA51
MTGALIIPGADQSRRYDRAYPGITQPAVSKLALHSTETSAKWGCPGYSGGASAPTATIDPWNFRTWQHFPATMSARALLNPTSTAVSENRDNVAQLEIIGYSDERYGKQYGSNLRDLPDAGYAYLARQVAWFAVEHPVPLRRPALWPAYPASYGNSPARMTSSEYAAYTGLLGHLHVSGNSHGDVTLDIDRLIAKAQALVTGTKGIVSTVEASKVTIARFQRAIGVDDDGIWGKETDKQAKALRNYLAPGRRTSQWDDKRGWRHVFAKGGKGSAKAARRSIQWALGVKTDGDWGPKTDAAWLAFRDDALDR